ncbi:CBO0543 family protein [Pseudalkalibacillus berkeleyi]|uniref:Uncharacterized protein n=1 Tax=Pseudalkalibacillus berkeleyi TaxID=1069813 RepID=A0ABS9GZR9_9BACL|nr:CBO0543 family protein [Pseudalkalibacillus berkeleyi]MCF6137261.1 hypothetical protein [Pseudalkalibacillus berkeleyi]
MFVNIVFGLLVPWCAGFYLLKRDLRIFLLIAPFSIVVAFLFDVLGFHLGFWRIDPKYDIEPYAALPMYFGVYPILSGFLFYFIKRSTRSDLLWIMFFTLITTIVEFIGVAIGMVHYSNGWTIFWTFISYLLAYIVVYGYYVLLKKYVEI